MRQEILTAYGVSLPRVPGKRVRFFSAEGGVEVEVFADGTDFPEWSTERSRLEGAVAAVCEQYGVGLPIPGARVPVDDEA